MKTSSRLLPINDIHLHVVEAGPSDGPLLLLLHGFPEFWWGWRKQIEPLAAQGFHVVAPDQRGYHRSDKPTGMRSYTLEHLTADVVALADHFERERIHLIGHDWGGIVAWETALRYPERIERLAIMNAPHPDVWGRVIRSCPQQLLKSYYIALFQLPWLPEFLLRLGNYALLRAALTRTARAGTFSSEELSRYIDAWSQPGALTAMLNYYRALRYKAWNPPREVQPETLLIWGVRDAALDQATAKASLDLCRSVQPIFVEQATHWVQLDAPTLVNHSLTDFFQQTRTYAII